MRCFGDDNLTIKNLYILNGDKLKIKLLYDQALTREANFFKKIKASV